MDTNIETEVITILRAHEEFLTSAFCLRAVIKIAAPSEGVTIVVDRGVVGAEHAPEHAVFVQMTIRPDGWSLLSDPDSVNITLNRLFRLGHIEFGDDLHDVMHHWSAFFWLVAAFREVLSGVREV